MLLNLSNHHSTQWPAEQRIMAEHEFGSILDIPFPAIDPQWPLDRVRMEAEKYFNQIRKEASEQVLTVHLMGEMTFCFLLLNMLSECGIPAVASTTHRIVNLDNGVKTTHFEFAGFRSYY